jgi:hypothetical protein
MWLDREKTGSRVILDPPQGVAARQCAHCQLERGINTWELGLYRGFQAVRVIQEMIRNQYLIRFFLRSACLDEDAQER